MVSLLTIDHITECDCATLTRVTTLHFLQRTGLMHTIQPLTIPAEVANGVKAIVNSWDIDSNISRKTLTEYIRISTHLGHAAYRHTGYDLQISLYTFCCLLFDDGMISRAAASQFVGRMASRQTQLDPLLDRWIECVLGLSTHLPSYGANAVFTATLDYVNFDLLRHADDSDSNSGEEMVWLDLKPGSTEFIEYARVKDGFAEGFVAAIWPKSDFTDVKMYIQAFLPWPPNIAYTTDPVACKQSRPASGKTLWHDLRNCGITGP
ncbi:hypothetical protein K474DRAFT_1680271 [Panus rudis PR-1116 ss-1]|nr:hypothetical protein K474DRAFT_1680271 [Panus rudis PR-1116 ss-1]